MTRNLLTLRPLLLASLLTTILAIGACTAEMVPPVGGSGGAAVGSGGAGSGGAATGGAATGGAATGGTATGGTAAGGTGSGGERGLDYYRAIPDGPTYAFFTKVLKLWNPNNCLSADCHGGNEAHISFVVDDGLYARVFNAVSDDVCLDASSMPQKLIVPGDPDASALIRILEGPCENEGRMPGGECIEGSDCLDPAYIEHLRNWILAGALEE